MTNEFYAYWVIPALAVLAAAMRVLFAGLVAAGILGLVEMRSA